ncbi:MAG: hypothetical protein ACLQDY_24855 [Streptosporangiaceae bacterium]
MQNKWWAPAALAAAGLMLAACGSSGSSSTSSSGSASSASGAAAHSSSSPAMSHAGIKTASTSLGTVLVNSSGRTLYWFALDTPTTSKCTGSCATYWPPVTGAQKAAAGVSLSGKFATIKRSGGQLQATYDGHPLYTYAGDSAAGQVKGNGLNASGGLWWAMTPSGAKLAAKPSASKSSSGGGSGGY